MRELDMSQHGGAMTVYSGYGFGKKWRKFLRGAGKTAKNLAKGVAFDTGKATIHSALNGHMILQSELKDVVTQAAKNRAKNEAKRAIRPYL